MARGNTNGRSLTKVNCIVEATRLADQRRKFRLRRIPKWEEQIRLALRDGDKERALRLQKWLNEDRRALEKISARDHLQ